MSKKLVKKDKFNVYVYLDPRKPGNYSYQSISFLYEPFYLGKGLKSRITAHLTEHLQPCNSWKNSYKQNKIKAILNLGLSPIILTLHKNISEEKAYELETRYITEIGRLSKGTGPLTNISGGGPGRASTLDEKSLQKLKYSKNSEEHKKIMSEKTFNSWNDKEIAEKRKKGISEANKRRIEAGIKKVWINNGIQQGFYLEHNAIKLINEGWVYGQLTGKKKGLKRSEQAKQNMREANQKPKNKLKKSNATKKNWENPEYREKRNNAYKEACKNRKPLEKKIWVNDGKKSWMILEKEKENYPNINIGRIYKRK